MLCRTKMKDAPRPNLHNHQHVDEPKCGCHDDEEVRGDNRFGMIADEGHPPLSWSFWTFWILGHIPTNRTRRNPNPDLQQQFIGDPFLSPRRIVRCHSTTNLRTSAGTRGRPLDRDFHFQNSRNPLRCHRINVSGLTTVKASRHSKYLERYASVKRIGSVALRGFLFRSTYSTSCLRRNRFSAASAEADRNVRQKKIRASTNTLEAQHRNGNRAERLDIADRIASTASS